MRSISRLARPARLPSASSTAGAPRASRLTELVDGHLETLGGELEGALPSGARMATLVVRLDAGEGIHQVQLSDGAQHGCHRDVGHRELGVREPPATFEATL